jgi:hypothetical protein
MDTSLAFGRRGSHTHPENTSEPISERRSMSLCKGSTMQRGFVAHLFVRPCFCRTSNGFLASYRLGKLDGCVARRRGRHAHEKWVNVAASPLETSRATFVVHVGDVTSLAMGHASQSSTNSSDFSYEFHPARLVGILCVSSSRYFSRGYGKSRWFGNTG